MDERKLDSLIRRYEEVFIFANKKLGAILTERLSGDITLEQYGTLRHIGQYGPCPASTVAEYNCVNRSATTAMIDRLVAKGYVERIANPSDRRVVLLQATAEAEQVLVVVEENLRLFVHSYLEELEEDEVEQFIRTYEKIWRIINEKEGK
ncbi:MarR family winged helix-turn-helix transcriptional regulator [Ectobacillus sp. sgz5001026]|uniref:MarR family winged helix-turn-helix transcriptional regulator n=1 Tax=Ectobacillus sp. sgz5001026 TaxID=3242473 RepID=UPI0036D39839